MNLPTVEGHGGNTAVTSPTICSHRSILVQTFQARCTQNRNWVVPPCFISHYQRANPTDFSILRTSPHITCCFDFLPLCLSTQLMASLPAWVIRAECINLVFIYSPWIQHGPTMLEILPLFGSVLYHGCHFLLNPWTFSWPRFSGPGRILLGVTGASACELGVSHPSFHASGGHVHCFKAFPNYSCQ